MSTLSFDSTAAQSYDIMPFLTSKLQETNDKEVTLDLSKAPKNRDIKNQLAKIFETLSKYNVVKVDLSGLELNDQDAQKIATALTNSRTIKTVVLSNNRIHDQGVLHLAKAMNENHNLDIQLSHNGIGSAGAVAFVKAAVGAGKTVIDLSFNRLGDLGAKNVAQELAKNAKDVQMLNLKGNNIGNTGDKHLASNVPKHIEIYYRIERGSILNSCPGMSNAVTRFCAAPIDYMLSSVLTKQEPEGTIAPRTK